MRLLARAATAALIGALGVAAVGSCTPDPAATAWRRGEAITQLLAEQARAADPGTALRLGDLAPFRWQRLYVLAPGAPPATLADSLGAGWLAVAAGGPADAAAAPRLVFLADGQVIAVAALVPAAVTLAPERTGRGYAPDEAVFHVRRILGDARSVPRIE